MSNLVKLNWTMICTFGFCLIVAISSSSPFVMWVSMEVLTLFFIPTLLGGVSMNSIMNSWKYFIVQSAGSFLFLYGVFLSESEEMAWSTHLFIMIGLLLKLGSFPFMGWTFQLVENMDWLAFFFFSSFMKAVPLMAMVKLLQSESTQNVVIYLSLVGSILVVSLMIKKASSRVILTISSILNLNWMMVASCVSTVLSIIYLTIYSLICLGLIGILMIKDKTHSSTLLHGMKSSDSISFWSFLLCSSGIPPIGVFLVKVDVLSELHWVSPLLGLVFIMISAIGSFMYLKFLLPTLLGGKGEMNSSNKTFHFWMSYALTVIVGGFIFFF